jgi:multicomponent K+:H+ antiporter subunit E
MSIQTLLPQPRISLVLLFTWLLLQNSAAPGQILLGTILALLIPLLTADLWPEPVRVGRFGVFMQFIVIVLWDIVVANIKVAQLLLSPTPRLHSGFVELPLALTNEFAIVMLANTISLTPGTVTAEIRGDRKTLLIHCLDVEDEAALIADIKTRYEQPLKEVFEAC